jgi:transcriptional regulator with XRE-family HTH domain
VTDETDLRLGKRLYHRRRLLGMTQKELASQLGVRFQQIQKYECGATRVSASRLYDLTRALSVSVQYFFDDIATANLLPRTVNDTDQMEGDILSQDETLELVRAYYRLSERPRRRLLELAKALEQDTSSTGAA